MLWVWLNSLLTKILWLLLPPPEGTTIRRINQNSTCPACGNVGLALRAVMLPDANLEIQARKVMVSATCHTCHYIHFQDPVSVPKYPGVAEPLPSLLAESQ